MLTAAPLVLACLAAQAPPTFTTGPGSYTTKPPSTKAPPPPGFTTGAPAYTTGPTSGTTGVPGASTTGPSSFTSGAAPSFTTGSVGFTTGGTIPPGTRTWSPARPRLDSDGVWIGRTFVPTADAAPPPPEEERHAWVLATEQRVAALEARLDALKERVFAYGGDRRDALEREVTALRDARQSLAAATGTLRDVVPASFNATREPWDAALSSLEERAARVDAALAP